MRIYYNKQCIHFELEPQKLIADEGLAGNIVIRQEFELEEFGHDDFQSFVTNKIDHLIYCCHASVGLEWMLDFFELIKAGGGVVWNENNELLMIERLGKWDLPKGKLDPGEDMAECAEREVAEETGLQNIILDHFIKSTYHIYNMKDTWILKQTDWYKMKAKSQNLTPQAEEGITQSKWISKEDISTYISDSYANIKYLMKGI